MDLHSISLFSGVGMLDEGLRAGLRYLGVSHRTVCHVEREAYGASVLAARMEEGSMDAAPVWADVCTFDARAWHGRVDCIVAGFPCQDLSVAGRRAGLNDGTRSGLFFEVVRIATDSGAWFMVLENVAGIATATAAVVDAEEGELDERAAARVMGELADLGWDAEWITLPASDVGTSHGRARWFCLAWRVGALGHTGWHARGAEHREQSKEPAGGSGQPGADSLVMDDAERQQQPGQRVHARSRRGRIGALDVDGSGEQLADANGQRQPLAVVSGGGMSMRIKTRTQGPSLSQLVTHDSTWPTPNAAVIEHKSRPPIIGNRKPSDPQISTADIAVHLFSHPAPATAPGQESSPSTPTSPRHLNPLFGAWLMGWPSIWVIAEPHASSALATELWRSKLQQRLSSLLDEPMASNANT